MDSHPELARIDPELIERFRRDLARLDGGSGKLGVAISGGPDSLALLRLAHRAVPGRIEAATVDHGLRPESAGEARFVAEMCAALGLPHEILTVDVGEGNVQAQARAARYEALAGWLERRGLVRLLTAHHADDQAETLLMRLNRGSGLAGLAGVRAAGEISGMEVQRPLLGWRKAELEKVCEAAGIVPVRDSSNEDDSFDRVRIRKALAAADWIDPLALAQSAEHLAEALAVIEGLAESELAGATVSPDGKGWTYSPSAQRIVSIEVVGRLLERLGATPRKSDIARLVDRLAAGNNASIAGILARPSRDEKGEKVWSFAPEPPRAGS